MPWTFVLAPASGVESLSWPEPGVAGEGTRWHSARLLGDLLFGREAAAGTWALEACCWRAWLDGTGRGERAGAKGGAQAGLV